MPEEKKICKDCGGENRNPNEPDYCWRCWQKHPCPVCKSTGHSTPDGFCRAPEGCKAKGENHEMIYPNYRGHGHPSEYDGGYCKKCGYKEANIY